MKFNSDHANTSRKSGRTVSKKNRKKKRALIIFLVVLAVLVAGCGSDPSTNDVPVVTTPTSMPQEGTIIVSSIADSGSGTLRQALLDAQSGDTITFDPTVFPPGDPVTIFPKNEEEHYALPPVFQGGLTIDASNVGVILDGTNTSGDWIDGLQILSSGNIVQGMQIINFTGSGIALCGGSNNTIGGDRRVGEGPIGQGNLTSKNGIGIDICDWGSHNTVTGNIIGANPSSTENWGNQGAGIWIENGLTHNKIGPDNIIAHNVLGIRITGSNTFGNTITQNSIYDNNSHGIRLWDRGNIMNIMLDSPQIFGFDMAMGSVTGTACADCTVEFYSDSGTEGKVFEGQAKTDSSGAFTYEHGVSFTGPYLTATATDADGTTSEFSFVLTHAMRLQEGNTHAIIKLQRTPSNELELQDTGIGDLYSSIYAGYPHPADLSELMAWLGHSWIAMNLGPREWEEVLSLGRFSPESFSDYDDQVIDHLNEQGITIVHDLTYFDKDLQAGPNFMRFKTEQEILDFLDYVRMVVTHFKGRIQYYVTWNEPDGVNHGQQPIAVEDYINVIRRLVPVIREADPQARVVIGSGSDLRFSDTQEYLMVILESDIMPLVDGLALHPMYGSSPDYDFLRQYYYDYPALIQRIKNTATANGFTGEYFAEEMWWTTPANANDYMTWSYTEPVAAKYFARGIVINRGLGLYAGIAAPATGHPNVVRVVQNLNNVLSGARATESLPMQIESEAANIRNYWFSLSNGDYLVALWSDNVAVDNDPGLPAIVTFPGFSAQSVTGIDILHGFERQLITSSENENLIIQNLLAKDYPIILRLTP